MHTEEAQWFKERREPNSRTDGYYGAEQIEETEIDYQIKT